MKNLFGSTAAAFGTLAIACSVSMAPALAQRNAGFKAPAPGTVFAYRSSIQMKLKKGKVLRFTGQTNMTVLSDRSPYQGVPVYRLKTETRLKRQGGKERVSVVTSIRRMQDGNEIAVLNAAGKLTRVKHPHSGTYAWPMSVGKSWRSTVESRRPDSRTGIKTTIRHRVEAFERVTVPGGTFSAFRIVSRAEKNANGATTWFVPALGVMAKSTTVVFIFGRVESTMVLTGVTRP